MRNIITPNNLDLEGLQGNAMKDVIQDDVVKQYEQFKNLICNITTGFGKTNIAIKAIKKNPSILIHIVVPKDNLVDQWRKVLDKNGLIFDNIQIYVINTYTMNNNKILGLPELLIVDETHRCLNEDSIYFSNLLNIVGDCNKLLLSASLDVKHKAFLDRLGIINYYEITRNWAFNKGLVPYHNAFNVPIDFTPQEQSDYLQADDTINKCSKYLAIGRIYDPFKAFPSQVENAAAIMGQKPGVIYKYLKDWKASINKRKTILYNAENKLFVLLEMLGFIEEKCLVFCKSISYAESIVIEDPLAIAYHSKLKDSKKNNEKERVFQSFISNEKPHLVSVDTITEGTDIPSDCRLVIRTAYDQSERATIQITGRTSRFNENDLSKESYMFCFYVRPFMARGNLVESRELKWLLKNQSSEYNVVWFDSALDAISYVKDNFQK